MIFKLAFRNVKRQIWNYFIYFITVSITVALMFSLNTLIQSEVMTVLKDQLIDLIEPISRGVSALIAVSVAFVLGYVTRFLLGRRKKEFGLYLTLGMSRRNILSIFAAETAITFLLSLGFGLLLGLGLYQAIAYLLVNFLDLDLKLAGYSAAAAILTVVMVAAMFFVASAASLVYLAKVKIYTLLHSEQTARKEADGKKIIIWFVVFLLAVLLLCIDASLFIGWYTDVYSYYERLSELFVYILLFIACTILVPLSFCKGFIPFLFRFKMITDRGTGKFTLRQLSARLNSDSIMIGVLSLFLSITFVAINLSYAQKNVIAYENEASFPYDFTIAFRQEESEWNSNPFTEEDLDDLLQLVSSYATIKQSHVFHVYTPAHPRDYDPEGFANGLYESYTIPVGNYYRESDYLKFCEMLGYDAPRLNGGYLICNPTDYQTKKFSFSAETISSPVTLDGKPYVCIGTLDAPRYNTNGGIWNETFIVVPDDAITARELKIESTWGDTFVNLNFENNQFQARELMDKINEIRLDRYDPLQFNLDFKYYSYLYDLSGIGLILFASLFIGMVFVLMTMATLALKLLSMLAEDRGRFATIWRLGASETMVGKSLFSQMFFYFFAPFAVPLALCIPISSVLTKILESYSFASSLISLQILAFIGIMFLLFGLYFLITFLLGLKDLQRHLHPSD